MIKPSQRIAIVNGDRQVTFSQMLTYISAYAEKTPKGQQTKTLILSENREGWIYALYGIWKNEGVAVPVDANSTVRDISYIISDCQPQAIWVSADKEQMARQAIAESGVDVEVLLINDACQQDNFDSNTPEPINLTSRGEALALICYTSGTTGSPKGVMLTFTNIMANVNAVSREVPIFDEHRRTLILLPLHHVLPLVGSAVAPFVAGGGVAICPSLSATDIISTLQNGKVGIMIGVPRLWQTLYRGIKSKIDANAITRALYNFCDKMQNRTLSRIIFSSVHKKMGGHLDYCVAGGAALDADTAKGLKTLGLDVLEGYGMTECAPMITFTRPGDIRPGCVGLRVPSVEIKIVDGELCARGRNVMRGYYNRPEETAAVIDNEGWIHTGDLATIDETGHVTITGRKKEIIVLSNGKNVTPTEIEDKIEHYKDIVKEAAVTEKDDLLCLIIVPQPTWALGKSDEEMEAEFKRDVLQHYNTSVAPYKKIMSMVIYHGDLPRTRLEKLQRFKLKEIVNNPCCSNTPKEPITVSDTKEGGPYDTIASYIMKEKKIAVKPTDNLETDLAMDSLDKVSLQGFIEHSFGVKLTTDQIGAFATVAMLAEHVETFKTHEDVAELDWHQILTEESDASLHLPRMSHAGIAFTKLCKKLYWLMFRTEYQGMNHTASSSEGLGCIFAANHQSFMDGPLVVCNLPIKVLKNTFFYAKKDHIRGPLRRTLAHNHNIIVMDMDTLSDSIRQLGCVLRQGKNLVIFPEGTRTRDGKVGEFKKTFAILSKELGVPIVPVRISGAFEAWPRTHLLPRPGNVCVEYLEPILPQENESYESLAQRVRDTISK